MMKKMIMDRDDDDDNRQLSIFGHETLFSIQYPYPYLTVLAEKPNH